MIFLCLGKSRVSNPKIIRKYLISLLVANPSTLVLIYAGVRLNIRHQTHLCRKLPIAFFAPICICFPACVKAAFRTTWQRTVFFLFSAQTSSSLYLRSLFLVDVNEHRQNTRLSIAKGITTEVATKKSIFFCFGSVWTKTFFSRSEAYSAM